MFEGALQRREHPNQEIGNDRRSSQYTGVLPLIGLALTLPYLTLLWI